MQNLKNLDVFEILIHKNCQNARRTLLSDPRSYLYCKGSASTLQDNKKTQGYKALKCKS